MGIHERREREREELRKKILHTASRLVSQEGHENLTIRKLAREIEYSPRTIYLYFRDKEHLLHEIVEEGFRRTLEIRDRIQQQIREAHKSGMEAGQHTHSPVEIFEERLRTHIQSARTDPNFYRAVVTLLFEKNYQPGLAQQEIIRQTKEDIAAVLFEEPKDSPETLAGGQEPQVDGKTIALFSMIIFSTIRGFTLSLLKIEEGLGEEETQQLIDEYIAFVKKGMNIHTVPQGTGEEHE